MHSPHPHCSETDTQHVATLAVLSSGLCKPGKGIPTPTVPHAAAAQGLDHPTAPISVLPSLFTGAIIFYKG